MGSVKDHEDLAEAFKSTISTLRNPIPDLTRLAQALSHPLAIYGLLPRRHRQYLTYSISTSDDPSLLRFIPLLQEAILQHVLKVWTSSLKDEGLTELLDLYFCPPSLPPESVLCAPRWIGVHAYSSLLGALDDPYAVDLLARLAGSYSICDAYRVIYLVRSRKTVCGNDVWKDFLRSIFAVPAKIWNVVGEEGPEELQHQSYFTALLLNAERTIREASIGGGNDREVEPLVELVVKLINTGFFPETSYSSPQPSYFALNLDVMKEHLEVGEPISSADCTRYSHILNSIFSSLPSVTARKYLSSLLGAQIWHDGLESSLGTRRKIEKEARFLHRVVGPLSHGDEERWSVFAGSLLNRPWPEALGRVLVAWVALERSEQAMSHLLHQTLELWASPQHVRYSLLARHRYVTTILLLSISHLPPTSESLRKLSITPNFIEGIALYIGHADPTIRRCGMLVAEVVAHRLGKKLDFGDWDGEGQGKEWCLALRKLVDGEEGSGNQDELATDAESRPVGTEDDEKRRAAEVEVPTSLPTASSRDSDDESLTGYASSPSSSRPPSPTPSELAEIEKDPTLVNSGAKKVPKPVYLLQLAELLAPTGSRTANEQHEADRMEMALNEGAALIRRKKGYGLELEENAVNLACAFIRAQDTYDLDGFREKKEAALVALVACCPIRVAPCLIEQFFIGQYSMDVRFTILNALALGARELSGFAPPPQSQAAFPSKMLPPSLHRKYLTEDDVSGGTSVSKLMQGISRSLIDKAREENEGKAPKLVREKQLRIRSGLSGKGKISEIGPGIHQSALQRQSKQQAVSFNDVVAEHFVMPIVNRLWTHLRDEQSREERSKLSRTRYKGAGTGMILGPHTLAQLLLTIAILIHSGRHSPAFLAVMAPAALEVAVTLGTKPISTEELTEDGGTQGESGKKADVLAAGLELALVILEMSWELDGGRTISLEHVRLLLATKEWAEAVFKALEKGALVDEGGGEGERRVHRASAGLLLTIEQIVEKWRGAMYWV